MKFIVYPPTPPNRVRPLGTIRRLIEKYPPNFRRWCDNPENGGCACMGCLRWPSPFTVSRDPEGAAFPNPEDQLSREEVDLYLEWEKEVEE